MYVIRDRVFDIAQRENFFRVVKGTGIRSGRYITVATL